MTRKKRSDSAEAHAEAVHYSMRVIQVPDYMSIGDDAKPYFDSLVEEFDGIKISRHQLELIVMLARTMADLDEQQREISIEGGIVKTDKGTPIVNPRATLIQQAYSKIASTRRSLGIHARAQQGEARDAAKKKEQASTRSLGDDDDEELIPRLN